MQRRTFLYGSLAASLSSGIKSAYAAPNDRITIAAIGVRGRGGSVMKTFAGRKDVDIKYVVDIDESVCNKRTEEVSDKNSKTDAIKDFRVALDDPDVDAIMLGTPTHLGRCPAFKRRRS